MYKSNPSIPLIMTKYKPIPHSTLQNQASQVEHLAVHPAFQANQPFFRYPQQQQQEQPFNASAISPMFYGYSPTPYQHSKL
jgi:hypothetical protein